MIRAPEPAAGARDAYTEPAGKNLRSGNITHTYTLRNLRTLVAASNRHPRSTFAAVAFSCSRARSSGRADAKKIALPEYVDDPTESAR